MQQDVLLEFYVASAKVQLHESRLCDPSLSEEDSMALLRDIEQARRDLGAVLIQLLNSAIPSCMRFSRLFRNKYTEEIDLRTLERCLVAAANKVVLFDPDTAPRSVDLRPAQPSAANFLDLLSRVQSLVLADVDAAAAQVIQPAESPDQSSVAKENSEVGSGGPTNRPKSPGQITSSSESGSVDSQDEHEPSRCQSPHPRAAFTLVPILVKVGRKTYSELLRLPPASLLCLSDELGRCLVELDDAAAWFEFEFVKSFTRRMRTPRQANELQMLTVLFSESLMWSLAVRLVTVQQLADRDPSVILALPRLTILIGTRLLPNSPIGSNRLETGKRLPYVFTSFRADLAHISRQLGALRLDQLCRLALWLGPRGLPNLAFSQSSTKAIRNPTDPRSPSPTDVCPDSSPVHCGFGESSPQTGRPPVASDSVCHAPGKPVAGRTWKTHLAGLHRIFKCISSVADGLHSQFPTEIRHILQTCIEMHDTSNQDDALALMEGKRTDPNTSCSDPSSETEAEVDIPATIDTSEKRFQSLGHLFDWSKVVSNRDSLGVGLSDALKRCFGDLVGESASTAASDSDPLRTSVVKEPDHGANSTPLEFGLDVIGWLNSSDPGAPPYPNPAGTPCACDRSALSTNPATPHRLLGIFNKSKAHLGVSVEGEHSQCDRALVSNLPPWQPDHVSRTQREATQSSSDSAESSESSVDDDTDEQRQQQSRPFVVGRHCAHCLQAFHLFRRRHHCRRCGHIFCGTCCNRWQPVDGLATTKPVRVCVECYAFLQPDF